MPDAPLIEVAPSFELPCFGYFHGGKRTFRMSGRDCGAIFNAVGQLSGEFQEALRRRGLQTMITTYHRKLYLSYACSIVASIGVNILARAYTSESAIWVLMGFLVFASVYTLLILDAYRLLRHAVRKYNAVDGQAPPAV